MARQKKDTIVRKPIGTRIDIELFWKIKQQALVERKDIYEVVEQALKDYLQSKGVPSKKVPITEKERN